MTQLLMSSHHTTRLTRNYFWVHVVGTLLLSVTEDGFCQQSALDITNTLSMFVEPRLSLTETVSSNVTLSNERPQHDQITEISPGILIRRHEGRFDGYLDYSASKVLYAQNQSPSRTQNSLNTFGTLEASENFAYLDFRGAISQQVVSAFSTQSPGNFATNSNRTEVSNYFMSPYLQGQMGDVASYEVRYSRAVTQTDISTGSGITETGGAVRMKGQSPFRKISWSIQLARDSVSYSAGRSTDAEHASVELSYLVTPQVSVLANAGRGSDNYTSLDSKKYDTGGIGFNWSPSERTRWSATQDHQSFGEAHTLSFEHRTARTIWRFNDSKSVSTSPNQINISSIGTIYDLLFIQFEGIEPDRVARANLVRAYLLANGINANTLVVSGFLTSALTLQRQQDFSFALLGVRDTLTVLVTRNLTSRLDGVSSGVDDLSLSPTIRQHGISVTYTHRMTPQLSLGVLVSQQNTFTESSLQDSTLRSFNANLMGRVGKSGTSSVGLRRVTSVGTSPYTETAVIGTVNFQF